MGIEMRMINVSDDRVLGVTAVTVITAVIAVMVMVIIIAVIVGMSEIQSIEHVIDRGTIRIIGIEVIIQCIHKNIMQIIVMCLHWHLCILQNQNLQRANHHNGTIMI